MAAGAWRALEAADSAESAGGGGCWLPSPQVAAAVGWRREVASAGEEKWRLAAGEVGVWRLEKWRTGVLASGVVARETGGRRRLEKWRLAA